MVAQGLAPSRARAQALIAAGVVTVNGRPVSKPSASTDGEIAVTGDPCPWVSRAALKLVHGLDHFDLHPEGVALDIGASTGGFTEVLLARGAAHVHALDVGHGQLHDSLRADPRITVHEKTNARAVSADLLGPLDWIVSDVSFISLEKALPAALMLARPGATLLALIKPQFEAGRAEVGKGGVVKDEAIHQSVVARIEAFLLGQGWSPLGTTPSPIKGSDGNTEFLIAARNAP